MRLRVALMLVLICAFVGLGLQVQPESAQVSGEVGDSFEQVFTIVNNDPRPITATLTLDPHSQYLADAVSLSEESVSLQPFESANIQVRGTIPVLGPEVHRLVYGIDVDNVRRETLTVSIPVEGTPQLHPKIDIAVGDVFAGDAVTVESKLRNFGNVIAYYDLYMEVRERQAILGEVTYPLSVQVLPGEEQDILLLYTQHLDPGDYAVHVHASVNDVENVTATAPFRVTLDAEEHSIVPGENLILTLKTYDTSPRVEYSVLDGDNSLLQETVVLEGDTLTVPTERLAEGTYRVLVKVSHARGTDTTRIDLTVQREQRSIALPVAAGVFLLVVGWLIFPFVRLRMRFIVLSWRIARKEKELNALIRRAHQLMMQHDY